MEILNVNDRFFKDASGTGYDYATINRTKDITNSTGLLLLVEGYRDAAFALLHEITQNHDNNRLKIDSFIYPALYVYRHYLEIVMKDTLRYYRLLRSEINVDQAGFKNQHSLFDLWKPLRGYLESTYGNESDSALIRDIAEGLLIEFDSKDKDYFAFRYPFASTTNIDGFIKRPSVDFSIDLANLENVCHSLSKYLDGINIHASEMLDNKQGTINENY